MANKIHDSSQYLEMVCAFCPQWVHKSQPHRREVRCWVTPPPHSDSPVLRVYTTRLAHEECIQRQLAGIPADQEELFREPYEPIFIDRRTRLEAASKDAQAGDLHLSGSTLPTGSLDERSAE